MPSGATSPLRLSQQPAINFKGCSGYFSQTDNTFPNRSDKSGNTHKFDHIMRYILVSPLWKCGGDVYATQEYLAL